MGCPPGGAEINFVTWGATPGVLKSISRGAGEGHICGGKR